MTSLSQWTPRYNRLKRNDHHASNHQGRQQGLHSTAPPDRDAHGDDSEQRADPGHVPGRKRIMSGTQKR